MEETTPHKKRTKTEIATVLALIILFLIVLICCIKAWEVKTIVDDIDYIVMKNDSNTTALIEIDTLTNTTEIEPVQELLDMNITIPELVTNFTN